MKLIKVTWYDAYELSASDWYSPEEIDKKVPVEKTGELVISIGFVFRENNNHIILIQSHQPEGDPGDTTLSGAIFIPMGMVKDIKVLEE